MEKKIGVSAALAALIFAAGINTSAASQECCSLDDQARSIASLNSPEKLERELAGLRSNDPASPLIPVLITRMVQTAQLTPASNLSDSQVSGPY